MQEALSAAQEAEVKELAEAIAQAASAEFEQLARTLVGSGASPFGKAEFAVRDILLKAGAKAYEQYLAQKKRLRRVQCDLPAVRPRRRLPRRRRTHRG